jgi:hypothetical protein
VSAPDTQQGPPPPPQPPSGSPFGRFLTSPVLLVGVVALVVGFATYRSLDNRPGASAPAPTGIAGSWESLPGAGSGGGSVVRLELTRKGGTLAIGGCTGELTPRGDDVFAYQDTSGARGCPRRMRVTVSLVDRDSLELEARRRGREYASATLRRL